VEADHLSDPSRKWMVLVAVGTGTFMSALDGSVVNTVLPVITQNLSVSVATVEWVVTVYLLVVSGLLLSVGRLGDLRGHKQIYLLGFVGFVLGSTLCGLAPSASALTISRAFQALGAAMLFANSPAIITKHFPARQRGQALGLQATMTYLGLTTGPALGGWLAGFYGWRSVFFINIPVGMTALLLSWVFIPADNHSERSNGFDFAGAGLFMLGLMSLLLGLNQGHAWGWLSLPILALLAGSLVALAGFVWIEAHREEPMLDMRLFSSGLFSNATFTAMLNYTCVYGVLFLTPFYLIEGRGLSAAHAGLVLTAQPLVMALIAPLSGTLSDRIGSRLPAGAGLAAMGGGVVLLAGQGQQTPIWLMAVGLGSAGLGVGFFTSPNNSALMGAAPQDRQGIASGILATARNVGMVLGIGFAGAIFTSSLAQGNALIPAVRSGYLGVAVVAFLAALLAALRPEAIGWQHRAARSREHEPGSWGW
jgi:EmrB/QacA subfamily drug resistance transporter